MARPGAKILLVEDEPSITELVVMALERAGYQVAILTEGSQVMAKLRKDPVDLLVLDIMIPNVNGYDLCQKIRADGALAELPIIMLSALAQRNEIEAGIRMGADIYMTKPFQNKQLLDAIEKLLSRKEA